MSLKKNKKVLLVDYEDIEKNALFTLLNYENKSMVEIDTVHDQRYNLDTYDSMIINLKKTDEDIFNYYFEYFKKKPVLACGYACIFLSKHYNCAIVKNKGTDEDSDCLIKADKRYMIHSNINNIYNRVKLKHYENRIIIPNESENKSITYCTSTYMDTSYKFMYNQHYGVLFSLNDSCFGSLIVHNFINHM
jgi:hypothetical protein|uniref:Glutamine amidotransferase domain-containing protein n=1 Tax=viral metagenome TaxID=1070528 RepID=A0A6C0BQI4_9ZZZZ